MEPMKVKIAVAQIDCKLGDVRANIETIRRVANNSMSKLKPDIVCFPELATTGYSLNSNWRKYAEEIPGKSTDQLSLIATEVGVYFICGIDELDSKSGRIYDSAILFSPNGKIAGIYRKVHLWNREREFFANGQNFPVFETRFGKVGIGICYDIEFPEAARSLASAGADILFFPSAQMSPMERHVETYALSRAAENTTFVALSNRIGKENKTHFFGASEIVTPDCKILAKTSANKSVAFAEVDLSLLRKLRPKKMPYLSQLVPEAYVIGRLGRKFH